MTGVGLFVYGSLKKGECNHGLIEGLVREVVPDCYVFGEIYKAGGYAALVLQGTRKIRGELLMTESLDKLLRITDELEGSDYERVLVEVHREVNGALTEPAWVYRFAGDESGLQLLTSAEWSGGPA